MDLAELQLPRVLLVLAGMSSVLVGAWWIIMLVPINFTKWLHGFAILTLGMLAVLIVFAVLVGPTNKRIHGLWAFPLAALFLWIFYRSVKLNRGRGVAGWFEGPPEPPSKTPKREPGDESIFDRIIVTLGQFGIQPIWVVWFMMGMVMVLPAAKAAGRRQAAAPETVLVVKGDPTTVVLRIVSDRAILGRLATVGGPELSGYRITPTSDLGSLDLLPRRMRLTPPDSTLQ
jgi:hypothetical protein